MPRAARGPPLWPAGHLPLTGEIRCHVGFRQSSTLQEAPRSKPPISPLEGEMPGRAERGLALTSRRSA
ncbi:lytic murein transglycosylase [Mesorhizobium erdmanii]|uniref:Lytic murein transglycosylase n=1 Tax=Mesorhizobium erdmanii TaxID=1777866 RepID=A0A6M7UQV6_9HYPH|nr:lytic murein transglycosylase [Mesorhizobium erdmanii]